MKRSRRPKALEDFADAHDVPDIKIRPARRREKPPAPYSIRFTEEERERLNRDAGKRSWSSYIREKLFGGNASRRPKSALRKKREPVADHEALGRVLGALGQSRLSSNLNQIAKAANQGSLPVPPELTEELSQACAEIQNMRQELLRALGLSTGEAP